jgi:DNA polymerase-1
MITKYELITTPEGLERVLDIVGTGVAALDFEGWDFKTRLAQICNDDVWAVIDFGDMAKYNWFDEVAHWFEEAIWVVFHAGHEKRCFAAAGAYPTCWDAANLRKSLEGGGHMSLKQLVGWELGIEMDKTEQASKWNTGDLTPSQLDYAAGDARHTWDSWVKMRERATDGQMECFDMLDGMWDGVIEMEEAGLKLDVAYHRTLIDQWVMLRDARVGDIRELITADEVANLNSGKQLNDYFAKLLPDEVLATWPKTDKTGLLSTANKHLLNMAGIYGGSPLGDIFRLMAERSTLEKYLSSFGETLIRHANVGGGRVRASYNIAAAITCRFSSSGPNLQQTPRDRDFFGERLSIRTGFVAEPGNKLVSFDYSGIEMRTLALVSGDTQLLEDVVYGDPHAVMAEYVVGRPIDKKVTEDYELRQSMKAVNFGIVYGTTALGLAGRQGWTYQYAEDLLRYWGKRYPVAWELRTQMQDQAKATGYLHMIDGGKIFLGKTKPSMTKCSNYPVQRAALSVMAHAIIRHKDSLDTMRTQYPSDFLKMCSTIHDALIDEAADSIAMHTMRVMKKDMELGFLDVFPGQSIERLLEGGMGPSWGELEDMDV